VSRHTTARATPVSVLTSAASGRDLQPPSSSHRLPHLVLHGELPDLALGLLQPTLVGLRGTGLQAFGPPAMKSSRHAARRWASTRSSLDSSSRSSPRRRRITASALRPTDQRISFRRPARPRPPSLFPAALPLSNRVSKEGERWSASQFRAFSTAWAPGSSPSAERPRSPV